MSQSFHVVSADVLKWGLEYDGPPFHALFSDPPYHLTTAKRFGKGAAPAQGGKDGMFARSSKGFMGQRWDGLGEDGKGIAFKPETWAMLASHLHPGAFMILYGAARTYHRVAVAIEDAAVQRPGTDRWDNLIIHPDIFMYTYGNGPVKARAPHDHGKVIPGFEGSRYGMQAIKPAVEPVLMAQRRYIGRPADNIRATGAGALFIDGVRVPRGEDYDNAGWGARYGQSSMPAMGGHQTRPWVQDRIDNGEPVKNSQAHPKGGYPSNLVLQHAPECLFGECVPGCPVRELDGLTGGMSRNGATTGEEPSADDSSPWVYEGGFQRKQGHPGFDDEGSASRYFNQFHWVYEVAEQLLTGRKLVYTSKPGELERDAGLWDLPAKTRRRANDGGYSEKPSWAPTKRHNHHPTLKSIEASQHMATLLLPPERYKPRRILVPFAGSGSEAIGCLLAGWDEVWAIEANEDDGFPVICETRLGWWLDQINRGFSDIEGILGEAKRQVEERKHGGVRQLDLLDLLG